MPRMGLGLGLGLVPKILGDGSSNPLPELGLIANYQARFNDLSLIPTNKVAGWDDSASKALGSELFSGFSFFGATWSDNGDGSYTSTGSTNDLMEVQLFTLGEIYEITYTIDSISSGAITPKVGNTQGTRHSEVGTYTEYLICSNGLAFRFVGRNNFIGTVSNLSVKQALSGYNTLTQSTSSQMPTYVEGYKGVGDEQFGALIGVFADTGWTINGDGSYTVSSAIGSYKSVSSIIGNTNGITQAMSFTIDSISSGYIQAFCGGGNTPSPKQFSTIGDYEDFNASSNNDTNARFQCSPDFVGTISNLSCKLAERDETLDTVSFDTDDNMVGLPTQSGDFSYVFRGIDMSNINSFGILQSTTSNSILNRITGGSIVLTASDSTNVLLSSIADGQGAVDYILVYDSALNEVRDYIDGSLTTSRDVTGKTYSFDTLGRGVNSLSGTLKEVGVYDRALTLEEIEKI